MSRLIVLSNRVSVPRPRGEVGAQGGLAVALGSALRERSGLWFGWSGEETETFSGHAHTQHMEGVTTATIDLEHQDIEEYYNGYANRTLWPLFHYRIDLAEYVGDFGKGYERVNQRFADSVGPLIEPEDIIWVHDYHLIPLGERLRARGAKNKIGFFLHIPWPPRNLLVALPFHERLVRTMLAYDLIGFQDPDSVEAFLNYCTRELQAEINENGTVAFEGRLARVASFPIGLDYEEFNEGGRTGESRQIEQRMRASSRRRKLIVGVDRLDYSKGLPERFDAIGHYFETHPDRVKETLYVQIAPPSRQDVDSYRRIRNMLEQKAGEINGACSEVDLVPIRYVNKGYSRAELFGIYRAAHVGLVTPLRDGMNLVAKEYVAAQDPDDPGVLVLSRFAGAAQQMEEALLVNPYSVEETSSSIALALNMPLDERKARWKKLNEVVARENVENWRADFIGALEAA